MTTADVCATAFFSYRGVPLIHDDQLVIPGYYHPKECEGQVVCRYCESKAAIKSKWGYIISKARL